MNDKKKNNIYPQQNTPNTKPNYQQGYQQYPQQNQMGYHQNQYGNNMNQYPQQNMQNQYQNTYQPQSNQGYGFQPYGLAQNIIMSYADSIFLRHDSNRSGFIDVKEIYPAVQEIFIANNLNPPQYQHVLYIMKTFDKDENGLLDMGEFRMLLLRLNGLA